MKRIKMRSVVAQNMKMLMLIFFMAHVGNTFAAKAAAAVDLSIQSFENHTLPKRIQAMGQSELSFTDQISQHGNVSMLWTWQAQSGLMIKAGEKTEGAEDVQNLIVWVHSEQFNGALDIHWGQGRQVRYELNFKGWRSLWIRLNRDGVQGKTNALMNGESEMVDVGDITLVPTASTGTLAFDMLQVTREGIPHGRLGSEQAPYIVNDPSNRHNYPWIAQQFQRSSKLPMINKENLDHYQRIDEAMHKVFVHQNFGRSGKAMAGFKELKSKVDLDEDVLRGPHVSTHIVERYYRQRGFEGIHIDRIRAALYYMALQYKDTGDQQWKRRYIKTLDYLHHKGYASGSAMMNLVFVAKNAGSYVASLLMMRSELDDERWNREAATLKWICGYQNLYNPQVKPVDADKMLGDLQTLCLAIHFQPDASDEQKMRKLYDYVQLAKIINITMAPGLPDEENSIRITRPDYSIYHHGQEMILGYGYPAAVNFSKFAYVFRDGPAALDTEIFRSLINLYPKMFTSKGQPPVMGSRGLSSGHFGGFVSMLDHGAMFGLVEAQAWLDFYVRHGAIDPSELQFDVNSMDLEETQKIDVKKFQGNWVQPYAAYQVHRRNDWMAVMRGVNQCTPSPEMFGNIKRENCANVFGDLQGYGFLQLMQDGGMKASGIDLNQGGWDWSMYPGATTVLMDHETLKTMDKGRVQADKRSLSGGLSHFNKQGVFYQRLFGHRKSKLTGIDGHKSYFFMDDLIVCLGSGLTSPQKNLSMVTNIFQRGFVGKRVEHKPFHLYNLDDDKWQTLKDVFPETVVEARNMNIMDSFGHVYHLPKQDQLVMRRGKQISEFHRQPFKSTSGLYNTVWIDHGKGTKNGSYEYAIVMGGGKGALEKFQAQGHYEVLQKDDSAHVVYFPTSKTMAYVFIGAVNDHSHGLIRSTKSPVLAMTSLNVGELKLTLSDPDPAIDQPNREVKHELVLKGKWGQMKQVSAHGHAQLIHLEEETVIHASLKDGQSLDLILQSF